LHKYLKLLKKSRHLDRNMLPIDNITNFYQWEAKNGEFQHQQLF